MDTKEWNEAWKEDGRPTPKLCPDCKRVWPEKANFCGICRTKLEANNNKIHKDS